MQKNVYKRGLVMKCLAYPFENHMISIVNAYNNRQQDNHIEYLVVPRAWIKTIEKFRQVIVDDY